MTGSDESCIKSNVIVRILAEYNTKMHAKERKWKVSKEGKISDLEIVAFCLQGTIYTKWRRFKPEEKLNTDQRPFSFVLYPKQTYEYVEPVSKHDSTCIRRDVLLINDSSVVMLYFVLRVNSSALQLFLEEVLKE